MPRLIYETTLNAPLDKVWEFFQNAENLTRITQFPKTKLLSDGQTSTGNVIRLEMKWGGVTLHWDSEIEAVRISESFVDKGIRLPFPFRSWRHEHSFRKSGEGVIMRDEVEYKAYLPAVFVQPFLRNLFRQRERLTKHYLESVK